MTSKEYVERLTRELAENCQFIADTLRGASVRVASDEEIAEYWPGGAENKGNDELRGWITTYAALVRFCGRIDEAETRTERDTDDDVIKALADTPKNVELQSGETITVYPKSFIALQFIERCDARIDWLLSRRAVLVDRRDDADDVDLLERTSEEIAFQYGLMAMAACHPGPTLPFDELSTPTSLTPAVASLSPIDFVNVRNGFIEVNALRLHVLIKLLEKSGSQDGNAAGRQNWKTFFSIKEDESGSAASVLMRDRSLPSQLAASVIAADVRLAAMNEAKRAQPNA